MVGAIVKRDILAHPVVTIRCFGWSVFIRALLAGPRTTFLSLLTETHVLQPSDEGVEQFVGRCVELELKACRVYETLARRFESQPAVCDFFRTLAAHETQHAELLELAETAAGCQLWNETKAAPWRQVVPRLEEQMGQALRALGEVTSVRQALQHVIDIESSEINDLFRGVIAAADSEFVRQIRAFHDAERVHLRFICRAIGRLDPDLVPASQSLSLKISA